MVRRIITESELRAEESPSRLERLWVGPERSIDFDDVRGFRLQDGSEVTISDELEPPSEIDAILRAVSGSTGADRGQEAAEGDAGEWIPAEIDFDEIAGILLSDSDEAVDLEDVDSIEVAGEGTFDRGSINRVRFPVFTSEDLPELVWPIEPSPREFQFDTEWTFDRLDDFSETSAETDDRERPEHEPTEGEPVPPAEDADRRSEVPASPSIPQPGVEVVTEARAKREREVRKQGGDGFLEIVLKSIPGEAIVFWLAFKNLLGISAGPTTIWAAFGVGLVGTALYMWLGTDSPVTRIGRWNRRAQIGLATVAFSVWVYSIGSPIDTLGFYNPTMAGFLILVYSFLGPPLVFRLIDKQFESTASTNSSVVAQ
jgi:hypothetical protein